MSELIVIGYSDRETALAAAADVGEMSKQYLVKLEKIAVIWREQDGKVKSEIPHGIVAAGTLGGMFWGMLIGLLFLVPIGGLLVGGAMGALMGKASDLGIKKEFQAEVQELVKPGTAALLMVVSEWTEDRVLPQLERHGGTLLRTSLSVKDEEELAHALGQD
jgi:uncharacterized membrane protein